ncbi:NIPSNAP family protein [Chelatococcus reniformis]|uniref:NIPSNAP family protein n=1 Tax=Chelatococcus reniformis TaxID=1494448 RepID=A0A916U943_9HYPH|nr:NIPSNAP family protein [Chelatococcus reniformis]GGC64401.1 NIPSNAP family protein [Chelatococcus reniformis]
MPQFYELTTLSCPVVSVSRASDGVQAFLSTPDARGALLGCWRTDIGTLGRLLILRAFASQEDLVAERRRALLDADPFNAGDAVTAMEMDTYLPFPFLPPVEPGAYGRVYEFRTYKLRPGGLAPTLAGWEAAMPARAARSRLVVAMYALDGTPRITHIWPYAGLDERSAVRAKATADGIWPPPGAPEQVLEASSAIAVPEPYSPLA